MLATIHYADLQVDTASHQATLSGKPVLLTETEYRLLVYLLKHQGVVCKRDDIIEGVWGERFLYDTGTLDVHLSSLRHKLGWTKDGPVRTIRGVGLILPHEAPASGVVKIDAFLREMLMCHEDVLRKKDIRCYLRLTPFVYEIMVDEDILHQIFSAVFALFLKYAPSGGRWEIASQPPPEPPGLFGELFVNTDQALRAAPSRRGWSPARELLLYIAHGMDHLSGADDHSERGYLAMRRRELAWLRSLRAAIPRN